MPARFIDNYDVILLDMGNTLMFHCDRFDDPDAIQATYEDIGGTYLEQGAAGRIVQAAMTRAMDYAKDLSLRETFPSLMEILREIPEAAWLPREELARLVKTFSLHELGIIPRHMVLALREMRKTHRLGLVSNIISPSDVFRGTFDYEEISGLFDVLVWSSDVGVWKPCPGIFEYALKAFDGVPRSRVVHVGDSFRSDIGGARNVNIGSVWISADLEVPAGSKCRPDLVVTDLRDLLREWD